MSLTHCVECGGVVSTRAAACPHCGCPVELDSTAICTVLGKQYNLSEVLKLALAGNTPENRLEGFRIIKKVTSLDGGDAKGLWDEIAHTKTVPAIYKTLSERRSMSSPKCPTCGSTNITKINAMARGIDRAFFGRHSPEGRAQFRCNKCGYLW